MVRQILIEPVEHKVYIFAIFGICFSLDHLSLLPSPNPVPVIYIQGVFCYFFHINIYVFGGCLCSVVHATFVGQTQSLSRCAEYNKLFKQKCHKITRDRGVGGTIGSCHQLSRFFQQYFIFLPLHWFWDTVSQLILWSDRCRWLSFFSVKGGQSENYLQLPWELVVIQPFP